MATTKKQAESDAKSKQDEGLADAKEATKQVDEVVEEEHDKGFRGTEVDMTPNEHYTVTGDASQTPEAQEDPVAARHEATNPELR
jgi:hypothetical protein